MRERLSATWPKSMPKSCASCCAVNQPVRELSGGNQQKVVDFKVAAGQAQILDEPTRGVDIGAKSEVRLMGELAAAGMGILMISSELPEILAMSDRIYRHARGRITERFDKSQATAERIRRRPGQVLDEA